jgi:hypothetical protein
VELIRGSRHYRRDEHCPAEAGPSMSIFVKR